MKITSIESDAEHGATLAEVERLWGAEDGTNEGDRLDELVNLISAYEEKRWPIESTALEGGAGS